MKKTIIVAIVAVVGLAYFTSTAQPPLPKVEYEFPEAMAPHIREANLKNAEKGLALYSLTCARCHGKKVKGKDVIPDFSVADLETYQIRIANAKHESDLQETELTAEELSLITTFFTYKKKNSK